MKKWTFRLKHFVQGKLLSLFVRRSKFGIDMKLWLFSLFVGMGALNQWLTVSPAGIAWNRWWLAISYSGDEHVATISATLWKERMRVFWNHKGVWKIMYFNTNITGNTLKNLGSSSLPSSTQLLSARLWWPGGTAGPQSGDTGNYKHTLWAI